MKRKTDVLQYPAPADPVGLHQDLIRLGGHFLRLPGPFRGCVRRRGMADHLSHDLGRRRLRHRSRADGLTIAHHGHAITNFEHFIREMRNVDDHAAVRFQEADNPKKPLLFLNRQR